MDVIDIAREVSDILEGTASDFEALMERKYPDADADAVLAELRIEICPACEWWVDCGELADDDGDPQVCDECREKEPDHE